VNIDFIGIVVIGIIVTIIAIFLKQQNKEYALLVSLAGGMLIFWFIIKSSSEVFSFVENIIKLSKIPDESFKLLLKVLGLAYITQISSDLCKDAGENAIASKLEIAGKVSILLISIPLFEKVIKMIINVMG